MNVFFHHRQRITDIFFFVVFLGLCTLVTDVFQQRDDLHFFDLTYYMHDAHRIAFEGSPIPPPNAKQFLFVLWLSVLTLIGGSTDLLWYLNFFLNSIASSALFYFNLRLLGFSRTVTWGAGLLHLVACAPFGSSEDLFALVVLYGCVALAQLRASSIGLWVGGGLALLILTYIRQEYLASLFIFWCAVFLSLKGCLKNRCDRHSTGEELHNFPAEQWRLLVPLLIATAVLLTTASPINPDITGIAFQQKYMWQQERYHTLSEQDQQQLWDAEFSIAEGHSIINAVSRNPQQAAKHFFSNAVKYAQLKLTTPLFFVKRDVFGPSAMFVISFVQWLLVAFVLLHGRSLVRRISCLPGRGLSFAILLSLLVKSLVAAILVYPHERYLLPESISGIVVLTWCIAAISTKRSSFATALVQRSFLTAGIASCAASFWMQSSVPGNPRNIKIVQLLNQKFAACTGSPRILASKPYSLVYGIRQGLSAQTVSLEQKGLQPLGAFISDHEIDIIVIDKNFRLNLRGWEYTALRKTPQNFGFEPVENALAGGQVLISSRFLRNCKHIPRN